MKRGLGMLVKNRTTAALEREGGREKGGRERKGEGKVHGYLK